MTSKLLFEAQTCGRCGGSGSYSYCSMHGTRCFGCGGKGEVLTKRGRAAQDFFTASASKPASEFKPGELVRLDIGLFSQVRAFCTVIATGTESGRYSTIIDGVAVPVVEFFIEYSHKGQTEKFYMAPDSMLRRGLSAEEKKELIAAALAYQATLTKLGKPAKRQMKEAA